MSAPIEPSWIIDGNPRANGRKLFDSLDGMQWTVLWECTAGRFNWHYSYDETIIILEGSVVLESDGLTPTRYGVGDVILFRKGARAKWHVEHYIKKLAVCRTSHPVLINRAIRLLQILKRKLFSRNQVSTGGELHLLAFIAGILAI